MADAVCNGKIQPKLTKSMEMRFRWLRDIEKQWRNYWHLPHNQTHHDISNGSQTSSTIHHGTWISINQKNTGRKGIQSAANPITNRQSNGRCSMQRKNTTKTNKINGNAIPLAQRHRMPKKFRIYWLPGKSNYADYCTKHHHATHHRKQENIS